MRRASALYRLLGDEARLRLLRVLDRERLNVTELTGILGLAQSGVSRHLGLLKDAGLVSEEKDAGYTYYRLAPALSENGHARPLVGPQEQFAAAAGDAAVRADEARLQEVLRLRKENFETHVAADAPRRAAVRARPELGGVVARARPAAAAADGRRSRLRRGLSHASKRRAGRRGSSRSIARRSCSTAPRRSAPAAASSNVVWKRGELEKLPIKDATVDVALLSQALHHAANPARAVAEAARITVPGGRVLVLDLREHREEWVRTKLGDRRLGFSDDELKTMLADAGLRDAARRRRRPQGRRPLHGADCLGTETP